ncbi:MAG: ATP-dependent RecD-like DNA helicase [Clostridia bacterium]
MQLEGQVIDIIYKNEINSYTVATFETSEMEETTIVGYLPFVNEGDNLKVTGDIVKHPDYGEQFKVATFEKTMPTTPEALEKYLSNGNFKGVGPATAKKIVNTFGKDTINVIKLEPNKLTRIKGINKEKALEIAEQFLANWEIWQIVGFLDKFGIGPQSAENVYKKLGEGALEKISENPYILIDVASKVNFEKVDKIALELGVEQDNYKRIRSGIKYGLEKIGLNGNSCVLYENLLKYEQDLLRVDIDSIENTIISMKAKGELVLEDRDDGREWVYSKPFYDAEKNIAERIIGLKNADNVKEIKTLKKDLEKIEKNIDIELSEKQKEAIESINDNNVCIITGGPGTGKTTIIKAIIELYKKHGMKPVLCAPTGRAAKRMTETTGEEAKTLHRLLELAGISDDIDNFNTNLLVTPIDGDIIIVDEASMIDMFLMNYLVKAIYKGTKLVLVGDIDQLPSVGPGSVLKDIIESGQVHTITLNQIFRQAAKSKIIVNAHRVNEGESFIGGKVKETKIDEENIELLDDFFYINEANQEKIQQTIISLCKGRLKLYGDYDFFNNIQIITPTKKGKLGTKELNKVLQNELNPSEEDKDEREFGEIKFREQDRVMQTKNNYNILWEKENEREFKKELGSGIFNGELGIIEKINKEGKTVKVKFDDGKVATYDNTDLDQLEHAYAITVHKSQGSEFDVVILVASQSAPMLLTRNLIYTAMTRAKKLLIVIGPQNVVSYMIQNNTTRQRNTGLKFKLEQIGEKM